MIGHDDVAYDHEAITLADCFEHDQKQIATLRAVQPGLPAITTAGDEMQLIGAVTAPGMVRHRPSLLVPAAKSCDRRPRRPHLYKKRKGGPATSSVLSCGSSVDPRKGSRSSVIRVAFMRVAIVDGCGEISNRGTGADR